MWKTKVERIQRSQFFQNALAYSGSNVLGQFTTFISGLVLRRIFPPADMGIWNLRGVVQGLLSTFDLGVDIGASRELPLMAGQGLVREQIQCRSTAFWFAFLQSSIIVVIWYLYLLIRKPHYSSMEYFALLISGVLFILTDLHAVLIVFFRSSQSYRLLSRILLLSTLGEALLLPAAAYWGGIKALFSAAILSAAARMIYFLVASWRTGIGIAVSFNKALAHKLVKFGAVIRIVDYPNSLSTLLPLLWVTKLMDLEHLALFSLAASFAAQVGEVSNRIGTVFITRFLDRFGANRSTLVLAKELRKFFILQLLVGTPLLCWAGGILVPLTVNLIIPRYGYAVEASLILIISTFFLTTNSGLTAPWFAEGKLFARGLANLTGLFFMTFAISVVWFVFHRRTIQSIAYGSVLGYAGYFGTMVFAVGKDLWPFFTSFSLFLYVCVAAIWTSLVLYFMLPEPSAFSTVLEAFRTSFLMGALGLMALLPLVGFGLWSSGIVQDLSE